MYCIPDFTALVSIIIMVCWTYNRKHQLNTYARARARARANIHSFFVY